MHRSWNLQSKIDASSLRFGVPEHVKPIRGKVLKFVEDEVYPLERRLLELSQGGDDFVATGRADIARLQQRAKDQGLWALGHPVEIGGQGMPFRDYIYVNEVQGRSELAQACLGTHTLQDSLMLLNHASAALQKMYAADAEHITLPPKAAASSSRSKQQRHPAAPLPHAQHPAYYGRYLRDLVAARVSSAFRTRAPAYYCHVAAPPPVLIRYAL
jgi:hypothetical protein